VKAAREAWPTRVQDIQAKNLVFLDEFGSNTQMARTHGRAPCGERVTCKVPHGHWKTVSTIAAMTVDGIIAAASFDGATDADLFITFVQDELLPALHPGQVLVMDNLKPHKSAEVAALVESVGARVMLLPAYSPDLNPIENAISKVKGILKSLSRRTMDGLYAAIDQALRAITASDARGYLRHCGYAATARCSTL
jgi:transposase